jgi:hypothetical protein
MATTISADLATSASTETTVAQPRAGFFKRVLTAMIESRERAAEREIERYIAMHGGMLTDSIERDLSRNFGRPAGRDY